MGVVVISPNPVGPGPCRVHLELDKEEARATINRLKQMLKNLQARASQLPPADSAARQICMPPAESVAQVPPVAPPPAATLAYPPVNPATVTIVRPPQPSPAPAPPPEPTSQRPPPQSSIAQAVPTLIQDSTSQPVPQASTQVAYPQIYPPPTQSRPPTVPPQQAPPSQYPYLPPPQDQQQQPPQPPPQPQPSHLQQPVRPQQPPTASPVGISSAPLQAQAAPPSSNPAVAAAAAAAAALSANRSAMSLAAMRPGIQQAAHQQAAALAAAAQQQQQTVQVAAGGPPQPQQPPRSRVPPTHIPPVTAASKQAPVAAPAPVARQAAAAAAGPYAGSFPAPSGNPTASTAAATRSTAPNPTAAAAVPPSRPTAPTQLPRPGAAPATAGARPPPAPIPTLTWEVCQVTDMMDHNKDPVQALQYCSALEGLAGGDGHGGWLISSSKKTLNLWECSAGGGRGAPSLMFSHGQETDFSASHLAAEPAVQLLYASSTDVRTGAEYVTVHSLNPDAGILAFKYKLAVAPGAQRAAQPPGGLPPARQMTKVVSLHPFGGGLRSTCGAAYQGTVQVFDCPGLSPPPSSRSAADGLAPKGSWRASEGGALSCLATSTAGGARVATGNRDGAVILWDMRQRPPANTWRCKGHSQLISGLQLPNDVTAVTGSPDGKVHIWDLRSTGAPRASATPDGSAVLAVKTSPAGDCVAVTTQRGLLTVDLLDPSATTTAVTTAPLARPFLDITWNTSTAEIYAASTTGTISVFRQAYA